MAQIIEIKARCSKEKAEKIRQFLIENKADFKGIDHQIDTYFKVQEGRLKLREGNIENSLIFYKRPNEAGPKHSEVTLTKLTLPNNLKNVLADALGTLVEVDKQRAIYFIQNVKFHLDTVKKLGNFVEIEAIDEEGNIGLEELQKQCAYYLEAFEIEKEDLIDVSYSDMLNER